mmetsp:Transcript_57864/g.162296  ORF Transcript_57864/g.162296 Transcript_57864/m.162296 type:complete len:256 (-) Transcript_57864:1143-1910(-)
MGDVELRAAMRAADKGGEAIGAWPSELLELHRQQRPSLVALVAHLLRGAVDGHRPRPPTLRRRAPTAVFGRQRKHPAIGHGAPTLADAAPLLRRRLGLGVGRTAHDARRLKDLLHMLEDVLEVKRLGPTAFHLRRVQTVVAEGELHDIPSRGAHGEVVLESQVLESLHQTPRHVARLCRLHRCVDEPFSAAHGVEEKLRRLQAAVEGVLHEATGLGLLAALQEVRQRPIHEAVFDACATDVLLPDACHHLAQVDG